MTKHRDDPFYDEFDGLLEKHKIRTVILNNWDNNDMGISQMYKIMDLGENFGRSFVIGFSAKGEILCPNCKEGAGPCGHKNQEES